MTNTSLRNGIIVTTDASCVLKGCSRPGIPTLVWPEGIDEAASDWLRASIIEFGVAESSAHEYANILRSFLRFCRDRNRDWQSVDDDFLIMWRDRQHLVEKIGICRVNTCLQIVFSFYRWAEETKRLRFQVGIYTQDELPPALAETKFPISARRNYTKGRNGRVYGNWTTQLTISGQRQASPVRHTPTESQIVTLHKVAIERLYGERDSLMFSWAEESGPRRAEFMQVGKSHMPTIDQLHGLVERDEPWMIVVRRKGGKAKPLHVPPDLILRTLDFIQFGRREIVDRCLKEIVGYREPDEVFLSSRTGLPLHPDSVTSIGRHNFKKAGIERANIHRLRARYAVRAVETLVDAVFAGSMIGSESSWVETILIKAAEMMGHSHPQSLRPYLTYVLNRRIQVADSTKAERISSRLRQLSLAESVAVRRLGHNKELEAAARLIQAGRYNEAAILLKQLSTRLES